MSDRTLLMTPSAVLDAISRAVIATDPASAIVSWNRGDELLYGWAAEEVLGRDVGAVLVPSGVAGEADAVLEQVRLGEQWNGDFVLRHKNGRALQVHVIDQPVLDEEGQTIAVVGESEDVSEQRRIEAELRTTRDEQELAARSLQVGGDFYDAFAVDGGRWVLAVGDVRGKGVNAAAVTGLARHTIRSIAMYEARPSTILSHLNRVLLAAEADRAAAVHSSEQTPWELTEPRFRTVAVATIEPRPGGAAVVVCSGGHPLPLVSRASGAVETVGRPGTLLGASAEIELHDVEVELGPGDSLVCFTDGIVERHHGRKFFDEDGIAKVLSAAAGSDAATLASRIEQEARNLFDDSPHDDMAVLVARVPLS